MTIQTGVHLTHLLILVLHFASLTNGLTTIVVPQNVTSDTGKTVIFECGFSGLNNNEQIRFYITGPKVNDSVTCPGDPTRYLPAQSMKTYCSQKSGGTVATWELDGTSQDDNNTVFVCKVNGPYDKVSYTGYLYINESDSYYAKFIGCVIGGFLACLITIVVVYILLKRSERAQRCFRSVGGIQEDVQSTQTKQY